ncbi:hypothetical protein GCM10020367_65830 [Streptomyces sannanensis]|uniref:Gas vesicle protein n=1 Tax=Streptomyces sannanensis TaxID=285536 RepID=A0ABP6S3Z6_9ACTN
MAVYIYSITSKQHPLRIADLCGVGEPPAGLRTVTGGPLCAVVSDAPEDLRPKRRDITAHQEVQQRLMADGTVLPLRFGLLAADDEAVRLTLEERAEEYTDRLRALEGCAEYHLKASQEAGERAVHRGIGHRTGKQPAVVQLELLGLQDAAGSQHDGDRDLHEHRRPVPPARPGPGRKRPGQRAGQTRSVRQAPQEDHPRMPHQTPTVGLHPQPVIPTCTASHQNGALTLVPDTT